LIRRDEINVTYILTLLTKLYGAKPKDREKQRQAISEHLNNNIELRSKKELIERFIRDNLPKIANADSIDGAFESFWTVEKKKAIKQISEEEELDYKKLVELISSYLFTRKKPIRDEVIGIMLNRPSLRNRASSSERITDKIVDFVETYIEGM
jgi:type I restriction enzyme R subunit